MSATNDVKALGAVGALAHAIAGTAGSLDYPGVSEMAFELEAAAKQAVQAGASRLVLRPKLDRFLESIDRACA